jgi:hypothetical protein
MHSDRIGHGVPNVLRVARSMSLTLSDLASALDQTTAPASPCRPIHGAYGGAARSAGACIGTLAPNGTDRSVKRCGCGPRGGLSWESSAKVLRPAQFAGPCWWAWNRLRHLHAAQRVDRAQSGWCCRQKKQYSHSKRYRRRWCCAGGRVCGACGGA